VSTSGPDDGGKQRDSFLTGEGDRWFSRNDSQSIAPYMRAALDTLGGFAQPGDKLLEIGCANGRNLAYVSAAQPGITCCGIEPAAAAVEAAKIAYPGLQIQQGTADRLPYPAATFNVVFFGFCLYLVDRDLLYTAVAEADRVLRDKGFLAIVDFDPIGPRKRAYRHLQGVFSYKMDYSRIFLASGHYSLAHKHSYSHEGIRFHLNPGDRVATVVLHKDVAAGYVPEAD
jgi:ubiquinone/menaquinone biosynthesis C-methylase UbiE